MHRWIDVSRETDFLTGSYQIIDWNGLSIIVIHRQDQFFAIENRCPHEDQTMEGGELEGNEFICPWHGAGFCIKTGVATRAPAYEGIKTYPTRIVDGIVQIGIDESSD